ncbi:RimJ/RimL family protein N-acetyltransferase [Stackebrandtia albiflava]|uniref:RimJ/RimL family protein N-acetyltransferase n=1 Tax=Stackebrandtia albiflava TaxID=406432 RepID=A0A562VB53_9ACTN|nr:GNAT family protein [Stackebrandtia albiflava]TWJ15106.1 RimJ/RimL family protein N-acetyltransferase [Stackebrandtia albiflava]
MANTALRLRPMGIEDWRAVHSWGSRPEVCRYQAWGPNTEEDSRRFTTVAATAWLAEPPVRRVYVAEWHGEVIGSGELRIRDRVHRQGEIQYLVHPDHWGVGLGTGIGRELLRVGFDALRLHRVYGTCDPRNTASAAVLRRLGMRREGLLRETMRLRDGWRDSEVYGLLAREWRDAAPGEPDGAV